MKAQAQIHRYTDIFFQSLADDVFMDTIGSRIKALRLSRQLTQVQLSKMLGIAQNTLSDMERGKTGDMTAITLESICRVLVTTPRYVLYGLDNYFTHETALMEAELVALFRELPQPAQIALRNNARMLREAIPMNTAAFPAAAAAPKPRKTRPA
jgi:transcriptional regulator with XRE-family HTH domain